MYRLNAAAILNFPEDDLFALPKQELVLMVISLRAKLNRVQTESSKMGEITGMGQMRIMPPIYAVNLII